MNILTEEMLCIYSFINSNYLNEKIDIEPFYGNFSEIYLSQLLFNAIEIGFAFEFITIK